jgi:hypothetical protein
MQHKRIDRGCAVGYRTGSSSEVTLSNQNKNQLYKFVRRQLRSWSAVEGITCVLVGGCGQTDGKPRCHVTKRKSSVRAA